MTHRHLQSEAPEAILGRGQLLKRGTFLCAFFQSRHSSRLEYIIESPNDRHTAAPPTLVARGQGQLPPLLPVPLSLTIAWNDPVAKSLRTAQGRTALFTGLP